MLSIRLFFGTKLTNKDKCSALESAATAMNIVWQEDRTVASRKKRKVLILNYKVKIYKI